MNSLFNSLILCLPKININIDGVKTVNIVYTAILKLSDILTFISIATANKKLDIKEMKMSISEMNEVVLYFGYLNDEKIHEMEKRIISFAKREDIISKMIYIDITNYKAEDKYKEIIKETFTDLESIPSAPMILYIKNGEVKDMIEPENGLIQTYQIKNLIDKYDLAN